jgi:hypothetical protein
VKEIRMPSHPLVRVLRSLAIVALLLAPSARAELAAWDQAKAAGLAKELETATDALYQTFLQQPPPTLGTMQSHSYLRLKQLVRMLRGQVDVFARSLEEGEGRDETVWMYETVMSLARSARLEAARTFVVKDVSERATAVRQVLNRLGPYYDPDFQTLAPDRNIEPGEVR